MRVGIMQPYFLPYLGYWQLMGAVDTYVVFDDVHYINGGWINRNRILLNGAPHVITVPLVGASQNKRINEIKIYRDSKLFKNLARTVEQAYRKAPEFARVYALFSGFMANPEDDLVAFLVGTFRAVCGDLGIDTKLVLSSDIEKDETKHGEEKILDICRRLGATQYCNAIGGRELYAQEHFRAEGIELRFLQTDPVVYPQFGGGFQPNLSILDVMMFNPREKVRDLLKQYTLIP